MSPHPTSSPKDVMLGHRRISGSKNGFMGFSRFMNDTLAILAHQVNRTASVSIAHSANMNAGQRLRALRHESGLTAPELGRRAALAAGRDRPFSPATVRNQENGTNQISPQVAAAYARVLKSALKRPVTASDILFGDGASDSGVVAPEGVRMVGLIGEVRAGAWAEIPADQPEPVDFVPVNLPEYSRAHLYALAVVGRSMDKHYPDGSVIVVCPAHEAGIRENDHVVVRLWRGGLAETTLKEVVAEPDGVALWPRSTDPAYQTPIRLKNMRDADDGPEIIGVVVGHFSSRANRVGPLLAL